MKIVMTTAITESQCGTGIRQNWTEMAQQSGIADIYHREHGLEMRHFENIKRSSFQIQTPNTSPNYEKTTDIYHDTDLQRSRRKSRSCTSHTLSCLSVCCG